MKGVFSGYLFNGFSRLATQMPYWIGPFALGESGFAFSQEPSRFPVMSMTDRRAAYGVYAWSKNT